MIRFLAPALVLLLLVAAPVWADELKTLDGKASTGTLEKITDTEIVVGGVATPIPQALLLTLRPGRSVPAAEKYFEVQLADDSLLRCTKIVYGIKDTELTLTTGVIVKTPTSAVLTVLRDAQTPKLKEQWAKLLQSKKRTDRIFVLRDGDLNPIEGALGAINESTQTIKFKPDATPEIEPELAKLQAFQFARTDAGPENNLCKIYDMDGNVVIASKLSYAAGQLGVTTPYGHKVMFANDTLARIDFNFGRLTYLSDLAEKLKVSPFLGGFNPLRKNVNLDANPLMLQDKQYAKGLSCMAGAEIEYELGGKYKKLVALLGVDSRIAEEGQGKVTVSIYCDREKRFSQEVSTKMVLPLNVDVRDVKTLKIVVAGSNVTNYSGHATLANAHVSQ